MNTISAADTTRIRPYTPADRGQVLHLLELNTPQYFAPSEKEDLEYYLDFHAAHYFVLEENNKIFGCGGYNFSDDGTVGKISWDIFHSQAQGKGLGTALTRFRIGLLKQGPGVRIISVRTSQLVWRFYQKFGFEVKEVIKDFWAPGFDLYRMEMPAHT